MTEQIRLEKIKRSGRTVSLELSTSAEPLRVTEEIVFRHRLVEGVVLTASQIDQLRQEADYLRCENEVARLLATRPHASKELGLKLKRKGFSESSIDRVIAKYTANGLIDDAAHAHNLGRQLLQRKPCGRPYLLAHLQRKHIDRQLAEQAADSCLEDQDEHQLAHRALEKKWRELGQFGLETARKKAYTYLAGRGFSLSAAKAAVSRVLNDKSEVKYD